MTQCHPSVALTKTYALILTLCPMSYVSIVMVVGFVVAFEIC